MASLNELMQAIKKEIPFLKSKFHLSYIGVFGSYIRHEEKPNSDLDILVEFNSPVTLFDIVDLEEYLSSRLEIKVDIVMKSALRKRIGKRIMEEAITL